ncbi:MAG TPA: TetR/AcrR family transcriptional regulator [Streptosporangiaceae bacterium]|nr:TetR/AcrR family transcriptional regulator [Streptosporangiaceae bacterium]
MKSFPGTAAEPAGRRAGQPAGRHEDQPDSRRRRNARGQGARLTEDIVCGALALIERAGSEEAVTLRAVAREVGIAAPSIYPHFADRDAIMMAVLVRIFAELTDAIEAGETAAGRDPVDRLVAGCAAYVDYGLSHPARYGVLFSERRASARDYCEPMALGPDGRPVLAWGADAFGHLLHGIEDCVAAGVSSSTDVLADATAVWVALHGTVTLRTALPAFPWPEPAPMLRHQVLALARVTAR